MSPHSNIINLDKGLYRWIKVDDILKAIYINPYFKIDKIDKVRDKLIAFAKKHHQWSEEILSYPKKNSYVALLSITKLCTVKASNEGTTPYSAAHIWYLINRETTTWLEEDNLKICIQWSNKLEHETKVIKVQVYKDSMFLDLSPDISREEVELFLTNTEMKKLIVSCRAQTRSLLNSNKDEITIKENYELGSCKILLKYYKQ